MKRARRLVEVSGIGPVIATAIVATVRDEPRLDLHRKSGEFPMSL